MKKYRITEKTNLILNLKENKCNKGCFCKIDPMIEFSIKKEYNMFNFNGYFCMTDENPYYYNKLFVQKTDFYCISPVFGIKDISLFKNVFYIKTLKKDIDRTNNNFVFDSGICHYIKYMPSFMFEKYIDKKKSTIAMIDSTILWRFLELEEFRIEFLAFHNEIITTLLSKCVDMKLLEEV